VSAAAGGMELGRVPDVAGARVRLPCAESGIS
jgi:hypothetical protein